MSDQGLLELAACRHALGLAAAAHLVEVAVAALEDGWDTPSLRELAGTPSSESDQVGRLFAKVLSELNMSMPTQGEALRNLARNVARQILEGKTTPYQGAKQIWELSLRVPGATPPDLHTFVYAVSEWRDRPESHRLFEEGIVAAARMLVNAQSQSG